MRYLSVFISIHENPFWRFSGAARRDAKLARGVHKTASRASISIYIAARPLRRALCTRPASLRLF